MFSKIVVANRGEIAVRVIETIREMGLVSVAIYSDVDRSARHVFEADEAYRVGPAPASQSYLNAHEIVQIAIRSGADGVHPGYGFLAENADFARTVADAGLSFVGPDPTSIELMGDKIAARRIAKEAGVPVVPGTEGPVRSVKDARAFVAAHGLPLLVKAGGGGAVAASASSSPRISSRSHWRGRHARRRRRLTTARSTSNDIFRELVTSRFRSWEIGSATLWPGERETAPRSGDGKS